MNNRCKEIDKCIYNYMNSFVNYLLSGITATNTGSMSVIGMDNFSITLHGQSSGSNTATGTLNINGRLEPSAAYIPIYIHRFAGNSGIAIQFNGPWENIQAVLANPATGTFTAIMRCSASKD